ncbi:MAG: hypothetical protein JG782_158 [Anaerophaga sp.]|nr:hypothetical protein [Anaerophaga sp.]MDK2841421.1 hypothetical protein [Anaerophaga sp.]
MRMQKFKTTTSLATKMLFRPDSNIFWDLLNALNNDFNLNQTLIKYYQTLKLFNTLTINLTSTRTQ